MQLIINFMSVPAFFMSQIELVKMMNINLIRLLLWKGANPNQRCGRYGDEETPLELARKTGDDQLIHVIEVFA